MLPDEDQAIVLPWASVMVIMVLLKVAFTCATPDVMCLRSRRRRRAGAPDGVVAVVAAGLVAMEQALVPCGYFFATVFFPAIGRAGPLRVRALVCVRWPRTGSPLRCRSPR